MGINIVIDGILYHFDDVFELKEILDENADAVYERYADDCVYYDGDWE